MTTSGSTSFNPVRDTLVKASLRMVNAYASTDQPRPEQMADAIEALNLMLKSWQAEGFLWLKQFATMFLVPGQAKYLLPGAYGSANVIETTVLADPTAYPATDLQVVDTTGMTVGDTIGVTLSANLIWWDTIDTITDGTNLVLSTGIPSLTAADLPVYAYTRGLSRPTRITLAQRRLYLGSDIAIGEDGLISRQEYAALPNKTSRGKCIMAYYDPQISTGALYVWPTPDDCKDRLILTMDRPIEDMTGDTDTFDVPQEWLRAIKYGLALEIAPEYALPAGEYDRLAKRYAGIMAALSDFDREMAPTYIMGGRR